MMHPSYFLILCASDDNSKRELALPAEVSEWLFFNRFWDEFNQKYQTFFGQYEEENLPPNLTATAAELLSTLIFKLSEESQPEFRFRYGWNAKKEELYCVVRKDMLVEQISKLASFMKEAAMLGCEVYCQL
jgi:hypothetical protein